VVVVTEAPMAGPFTAAMRGLGKFKNVSKTILFDVKIMLCNLAGGIGLIVPDKSTPAQ